MTPTQRSLAELRKRGYIAAIVEHWNPFAHIRQDLFGILDLVAIHPGYIGVLGIQCTSDTNVAARVEKAKENANLAVWMRAGNRFAVWGWGKKGPRGKRKTYQLMEENFTGKEWRE